MATEEVLASKQYLSAIGQWPRIPARANPKRWLEGFEPGDIDHATAVLESLVYFSDEQTTKLFTSLVHSLSAEVTSADTDYADRQARWTQFLDTCLVTFPTGETPSPTDSGYAFARRARQELGFDEANVLDPESTLARLSGAPRTPVLVVDDFAGSGQQFLETWNRGYALQDGTPVSFVQLQADRGIDVYYLPVVATDYARERIAANAPSIKFRTAHLLGPEYRATHPQSHVFPNPLRSLAADFIARASRRAGLPTNADLGFHRLALALAFEHSVPDATLPIIWADTPTWTPLMRRS